MTDNPYMRPYVKGAVTQEDSSVVCVPGMPPYEVVEPLAEKIVELLVAGKTYEAKVLMVWFGADGVDLDVESA